MTNCASCVIRKIDPNVPKYMTKPSTLVTVNVRLRNRLSGTIGAVARRSHQTNVARTTRPAASAATMSGLVQPVLGPAALAEQARRDRDERQPERDVDPEDPVPRDRVDVGAPDERPEGDAEAAHARPDAERGAAALGGEGFGEERQRERGHDGPDVALQRPRGDERAGRRG